jgi:hypothetical protein
MGVLAGSPSVSRVALPSGCGHQERDPRVPHVPSREDHPRPSRLALIRPSPRPGLRREEVAVLAGVSVPYYTRLERSPRTVGMRLAVMLGVPTLAPLGSALGCRCVTPMSGRVGGPQAASGDHGRCDRADRPRRSAGIVVPGSAWRGRPGRAGSSLRVQLVEQPGDLLALSLLPYQALYTGRSFRVQIRLTDR